jgi:site-specific DNA-methyltransferase (adenine-specific)
VTVEPYYSDEWVTLYHGDCREILPIISTHSVDLLLTDPPYGIDHAPNPRGRLPGPQEGIRIAGDNADFDPRPLLAYGRCVIWGANYFADKLPPGGWIVWSKAQDNRWSTGKANRSLAEVAWTNLHRCVALYNCFWAGSPLYRHSERGSSLHPNQKPVELMSWIVDRYTEHGSLVLDPYMGSGPVARSCKDLGRRYIGIELEERYCEITAKRLSQDVLNFVEVSYAASD